MSTVKATQGVDTHAHVFSAHAPAVPGARYRPHYAAHLADWRSCWPGAGISHGVVVQPSFFGADNRELLDTIASDPDHLRGVAVVPTNIDDGTLARFHAAGVRAIRLNLRGGRGYDEYQAAAWRNLFARLHARGWHLEIFVDTGRLPEIVPALLESPIAVVFDHFGAPGREPGTIAATFAAARQLAATREVWCKFSGAYRLEGGDPKEHAARWLDTIGASRIVWASDWPWTGFEGDVEYQALHARLAEWIDPALAPAVLWDNAARLYGFS
ncbi:MAG TPA: amidohydrolase family protein [Usitatibacter sp.]|nr:amidohydrolase family protein [Usitatibacter sp.]